MMCVIGLTTHLPEWGSFKILSSAKYLDFYIGPAAKEHSWVAPLAKFDKQVRQIAAAGLSAAVSSLLYSSRAVSVVGYVAQIEALPAGLLRKETWAVNKVLHAPGGAFLPSVAAQLGSLKLKGLRSLSLSCAAALLRTATDGKIKF